jgi:hypothetical protein
MITRHPVLLAGGIDLLVGHPLNRVQAAASPTGRMPRVRVLDHVLRVAEAEGLLK